MTAFVRVVEGAPVAWPLSGTAVAAAARALFPDTGFPDDCSGADLSVFGFESFATIDRPSFDAATETLQEVPPIKIGDVWTQQWEVRDLTAGERTSRRNDLKAYAAQNRWAKEQGGLVLPGGMAIKTDTEARVKIRELRDNLTAGTLAAPYRFKAVSGWVDVDLATINAVYAAIVEFVAACFATEDEVDAAIDAGTVTTKAAIDAAFAR